MIADSKASRFNRAVQLEKKGDYTHALKEYIGIINDDPSYRKAFINLGSLYSRMNKLEEAKKCYEAALYLGADYITYFNIGCIYYKMSRYRNALASLAQSSAMNRRFALSQLVTGLCHSRLNNLTEAERSFSFVLTLWPDNRVALTALAIICYNRKKYDDSLQLIERLLRYDAKNIKIRELKSDILLKTDRLEESASEIKILKRVSDGYRFYDEFIKSIPVETLTDRYGTIDDKIHSLSEKAMSDSGNLISLSLCHLFKGDTDTAIDYLYRFRKNMLH